MKNSRENALKPRAGVGRAWLILVVLIGFALRVYRLGALAIWWDESLSLYRATRDLATILSNTILIQNTATVDTVPPLYFILLHWVVRLSGTTEFALRFLSLAASTATIPLIYALARRWLSREVALVAAFLSALAPFYVSFAQEARPYALLLFLSTLAVYALTRAFWQGEPNVRWMVVYVLTTAAALYTFYYTVFLIPFHALLIVLCVWRQRAAWRWVVLPLAPLAAGALLVPLIRASIAGNAGTGPFFVPLDTLLVDLFNSFSVGITIDLAQVMWIDTALILLWLIGTLLPNGRLNPRVSIFLAAFLFVPVLGVAAASYIRPLYQNSRYMIGISPVFYLGVAAGIVTLGQRWRPVVIPALAVFVLGAGLSLNNLYFNPRYAKDDHRGWSDFLRERWQSGDMVILDSPHTEELYRYYASDLAPMVTLPIWRGAGTEYPAEDLTVVRSALRGARRVWFLEMDVLFDDPARRIEKLLNQEGVLLDEVDFAGTSTEISLSLFVPTLPRVNPQDIARPLDVAFTGHLRLRGYTPPVLAAGKRGVVPLFWQIDEPVGEDYAVSLRLVNDAGARLAQWDDIPLGNRSGTSTWSPGVIMRDAHELPIDVSTPAGEYRLQVVPYHAATGAALGDVVTLGEISVAGVQVQ